MRPNFVISRGAFSFLGQKTIELIFLHSLKMVCMVVGFRLEGFRLEGNSQKHTTALPNTKTMPLTLYAPFPSFERWILYPSPLLSLSRDMA